MSDFPQVPICLTGTIHPLNGDVSICMDNATCELRGPSLSVRLKPKNEKVQKEMDRYIGKNVLVAICGNHVPGPECPRIDVHSLGKIESFFAGSKPLWDGDLPWPW